MPGYQNLVQYYADALDATTLQAVDFDRCYDQAFQNQPLFAMLNSRKEELDGGKFDQVDFSLGYSPNTTWYSNASTWYMQPYEAIEAAAWGWSYLHDGITMSIPELMENTQTHKVVGLIQTRLENAIASAVNAVANAMIQNNPYGTTNAQTAGNPLSFEGISVLVDNGTLSSQVGQLSRVSYPLLNAQINYNLTQNSSLFTGLYKLLLSANAAGGSRVNVNLTTQSNYSYFMSLLQVNERYVMSGPTLEATIGYKNTFGQNLAFADAPVFYQGVGIPTGVYAPGTTSGSTGGFWYGLNLDTFKYKVHPDGDFTVGTWQKNLNGPVCQLDVWYAGILECTRPNMNMGSWINGG